MDNNILYLWLNKSVRYGTEEGGLENEKVQEEKRATYIFTTYT